MLRGYTERNVADLTASNRSFEAAAKAYKRDPSAKGKHLLARAERMLNDISLGNAHTLGNNPDQLVAEAEAGLPATDPHLACLHAIMGRYCQEMAQVQAAEQYLQRAKATLARAGDAFAPQLADAISNLSVVYSMSNRAANGLQLARQALELRTRALPPTHHLIGMSYSNIAYAYVSLGNLDSSLVYIKRAQEHLQRVYQHPHTDLAMLKSNLAVVYQELHQPERAIAEYNQAIEYVTQHFGAQNGCLHYLWGNLSSVYLSTGNLTLAEQSLGKQYAIISRRFSENSEAYAQYHNLMASLRQKQGQYADAIQHYSKSIAIFRQLFGPTHPRTVENRVMLLTLVNKDRPNPNYEVHFRDLLSDVTRGSGQVNPTRLTVLSQYAEFLSRIGRYAEAQELFEEAQRVAGLLNVNGVKRSILLRALADHYKRSGNLGLAAETFAESGAASRAELGDSSLHYHEVMLEAANCYRKKGDYALAERHIEPTARIMQSAEAQRSVPSLYLIFCVLRTALYRDQNNTAETERWDRITRQHIRDMGLNPAEVLDGQAPAPTPGQPSRGR
jgi:tetratricopeptide (TPR) repeat protein